MEIVSITKADGMDNEPISTLLQKGIRSESLYYQTAVHVVIKPTKWIDCFYRLFWESNFIHMTQQQQSTINDDGLFHMNLTLAEVFDFIYDATPPLYRNQLPDSMRNIDDIVELMKTFLLEQSEQQTMYQSILCKMVKYGVFDKPNNIQLNYVELIRKYVPTGIIGQVIYSVSPIENFNGMNINKGIYLLTMNNNDDVEQLVHLMHNDGLLNLDVCDIYKDPTHGMLLMIQYDGKMMNEIIYKSYKPFLK